MLITFSGLDGSGKSTLIHGLKTALEEKNQRVTVLTTYGHVGVYAFIRFIRDWIKRFIWRGIKRQVEVNDFSNDPGRLRLQVAKHGWLMREFLRFVRSGAVKRFVYIFDLCIFVLYRIYFEKVRKNILIMDRYFYDSLVDVAKGRRWLYIRLFLLMIPTPDLPIFVDVTPEQAFQRKGEYSVNYMSRRRAIYQKIFGWVHRPIVVVNEGINMTLHALDTVVSERLSRL